MSVPLKFLFNYKSQLWAGLALNFALLIYVYFIVDGGPASMHEGGNWLEILNEVPINFVFFLAAILKPFLMVWWRCRKNVDVTAIAGGVMLTITVLACVIAWTAGKPMAKDLAMYISWALLWGVSTYFVLMPQRSYANE